MKFRWWLFCLFVLSAPTLALDSEVLEKKLKDAQDYLSLAPSKTANILQQYMNDIQALSEQDQLSWHQTHLRASIALSDLKQVEASAVAILSFGDLSAYQDKYISLLSSLGIMMRRLGHSQESVALLDCGLKQKDISARQKLSLMISKGHSLRQLGQDELAVALYQKSLKLAIKQNQETFMSVAYNALGSWSLDYGRYDDAKQYFIQGLNISQKIARRYGQLFSGLQLLNIAILQGDNLLYQRLHSPVSRLVHSSKNQDRKSHLYWLEMAMKVKTKQALSNNEQLELLITLEQVAEVKLHNRLLEHFGQLLQVNEPHRDVLKRKYEGNLMQHFQACVEPQSSNEQLD